MDVMDSAPLASTSISGSSVTSKVSIFGTKSGFVIPRNKLSGSLVPAFRPGSIKQGGADAAAVQTNNFIRRNTKWGPDLSQDPSVRRARLLAYQTRLEQITRQLISGNVGVEEDGGDLLGIDSMEEATLSRHIDKELLKSLELERLESIGEILKLNMSYKAPSDYKPIMKEANVPVPVKEFPSYNFMGLLFGPGNDTLKRLEKETGAKIQVRGKKTVKEVECEVTQADGGGEICSAFEELHLRVSADTFDKVDAAVALIEILVKPVSGCQGNTPKPTTSPPQDLVPATTCSTQETSTVQTQAGVPQIQVPLSQPLPQTLPQSSTWLPPPHHMSSPGFPPSVNTIPLGGSLPQTGPPFTPLQPQQRSTAPPHSPFPHHPHHAMSSNTPPSLSLPSPFRQNHPPISTTINSSTWRPPSGSISVHLRLPPGQPFHLPSAIPDSGPRVHQNLPPPFQFQVPPPSHPHQPSAMPFLPPPPVPSSATGSVPTMRVLPLPSPRPHSGFSDFTFQPQKQQQPQVISPQIPPFRPGIHPSAEMPAVGYGAVGHMGSAQFTGNTVSMGTTAPYASHVQLPPPPPLPNFGGQFPVRYPPASVVRTGNEKYFEGERMGGDSRMYSVSGQQIYDPFSPTSSLINAPPVAAAVAVRESDPEYEDLMASVGVK